MTNEPFELFLEQAQDDSPTTCVLLYGTLPASPPADEVSRLLALLARWSGAPVELVLSVDAGTVAWFEAWGDATAEAPTSHLQVRFTLEDLHLPIGGHDVGW